MTWTGHSDTHRFAKHLLLFFLMNHVLGQVQATRPVVVPVCLLRATGTDSGV